MARPQIPKPWTLERQEAQRLLVDLQAIGCGIHCDGDELRITNLTKIPIAIWLRLENAGPELVELAREHAAVFEARTDWVN